MENFVHGWLPNGPKILHAIMHGYCGELADYGGSFELHAKCFANNIIIDEKINGFLPQISRCYEFIIQLMNR